MRCILAGIMVILDCEFDVNRVLKGSQKYLQGISRAIYEILEFLEC